MESCSICIMVAGAQGVCHAKAGQKARRKHNGGGGGRGGGGDGSGAIKQYKTRIGIEDEEKHVRARNTISAGAEWHSAARPPFSRPSASVSLPLGIDLFQGPAPHPLHTTPRYHSHSIVAVAAAAAATATASVIHTYQRLSFFTHKYTYTRAHNTNAYFYLINNYNNSRKAV